MDNVKQIELSINLGDQPAVKVIASNVQLHEAMRPENSEEYELYLNPPDDGVLNATLKRSAFQQLGNPSKIWVYI